MPNFADSFGFNASPFEKYVAENEPEIQDYAVTPPYFEETRKHTNSLTSFLLFGYRGSGKSATRLTNEKEVWSQLSKGKSAPLVVSVTNFEAVISERKFENITSNIIISHVSFFVIEALLLWISNQDEGENFIDMLNDREYKLFVKLVKTHYLTRSEMSRKFSLNRTMQVLNQTWYNKTIYWIEKKWDPISAIAGKILSKFAEKHLEIDDSAAEMHALLQRDTSYNSGLFTLQELVECTQSFGFSGVCVYVDKIDEASKAGNSSEWSAKLVYPILSQVQLLEVPGFGWIFFLWDKIKSEYTSEKLAIRLDKYAFSEISWAPEYLKNMISNRINYFSSNRVQNGQDLCESDVDFHKHLDEFIHLVGRSPRELIRLLDVLVREYDVKYASSSEIHLLCDGDFRVAMDQYIRNVVWTLYDKKVLSEILRLGKDKFINKDVQSTFRISDQGARMRIRNWTSSGAVRQSGTTAGDVDSSGKPANVYTIADPRIALMLSRELYDKDTLIVDVPVDEAEKAPDVM